MQLLINSGRYSDKHNIKSKLTASSQCLTLTTVVGAQAEPLPACLSPATFGLGDALSLLSFALNCIRISNDRSGTLGYQLWHRQFTKGKLATPKVSFNLHACCTKLNNRFSLMKSLLKEGLNGVGALTADGYILQILAVKF